MRSILAVALLSLAVACTNATGPSEGVYGGSSTQQAANDRGPCNPDQPPGTLKHCNKSGGPANQ